MGENRKRNLTIGAIVALVVGIPFVAWLAFGFFGVQSLWSDDEVDEELTTFVGPDESGDPGGDESEGTEGTDGTVPSGDDPAASEAPVLVATGTFTGVEGHDVSGDVNLIENPDGSHLVQFPALDSENGPDLVVWLSKGGSTDDVIDLGALKGNQGSQEYEVSADLDLSEYDTVLIWCRRFSVGFGEAPLTAA